MRTSLLVLLAGAAVLYIVVGAPTVALGEEWKLIPNIADPHVQGLGSCAVDEQNQVKNCGLRFVKVVSGKVKTTGGGTTYMLDVDALRLGSSHKIFAVEVVDPHQNSSGSTTCKVISFSPDC